MSASSDLPSFVSRNGELVPPEKATVSVLGETLYTAFGVYESIQLWNGVIFQRDAHLQRLLGSAQQISLPVQATVEELTSWLADLRGAEGEHRGAAVTNATIRLFAIGSDRGEPPHIFIWFARLHPLKSERYQDGVGAVTYRGERAIPTAKTLNTLVNTLARKKAVAAGEHEGLLVNGDGAVQEGSSSNFCVVRDGALLVPPPADILEGVTLQIVFGLAEDAQIPVVRRKLPLAGRSAWDEAFLTSTTRHVLPLVRLDGEPIGRGVPGPITRELYARFEAYFEKTTGRRYGG